MDIYIIQSCMTGLYLDISFASLFNLQFKMDGRCPELRMSIKLALVGAFDYAVSNSNMTAGVLVSDYTM